MILDSNLGLVYSLYIGGSGDKDYGRAVSNLNGAIIFVGETNSNNWPLANTYQQNYGANTDAFVSKISTKVS